MAAAPIYKDSTTKLKFLDTFHDFATKERKKKTGGKKVDKKDDEEVSESKLETMRAYIVDFLATKFKIPKEGADLRNQINNDISILTDGNVTNISDFENSVVTYYETYMPGEINLTGKERETTSFQQIVEGWVEGKAEGQGENSPLWRQFRLNKDTVTVLEINKGTKSIDTFTQGQRNTIANFILNFFFGTAQENPRCTFDATAGVPSKIFEDIDQIKNVIFPQTIADSATTTFGTMRCRNEFIFPGTREIKMETAVYTDKDYGLAFENLNFDSHNTYGFKINIKNKAGNTISLPFSRTQTEGPSVNYLIDILQAAQKGRPAAFATIDKKKQILDLGKGIDSNAAFKSALIANIKANNDGLFLDIKRSGDHEAVAATNAIRQTRYPNFIFVTIDILCALESRKKGNPTIWHHGERLILYRFPVKLSEAAIFATKVRDTKDRIQDAIACLKIQQGIKQTVLNDLKLLKTEAASGKTAVASFQDSTTKLAEPKRTQAKQIVTFLLQKRMEKLERKFTEIETIMDNAFKDKRIDPKNPGYVPTAYDEQIGTLEIYKTATAWEFGEGSDYTIELKEKGKKTDVGTLLKEIQTNFKTVIAAVNNELKIDVPITVTTTQTEIKKIYSLYVPMITVVAKQTVFLNTENPLFDYSATPFFSLYKSILLLQEAKQTAEAQKKLESRTHTNYIKAELKNLSATVQEILDQFGNEELQRDTPEQVELKKRVLFQLLTSETVFGALDGFFAAGDAFPALYQGAVIKAGGALIQKGGADAEQFLDAQDILLEVCSMATAFIESAFSTFYPEVAIYTKITEVLALLSKIKVAMAGAPFSKDYTVYTELENLYEKIERLRETNPRVPVAAPLDTTKADGITTLFIDNHIASLGLVKAYFQPICDSTFKKELHNFFKDLESIIEGTADATKDYGTILKEHIETLEGYIGESPESRQYKSYTGQITIEVATRTREYLQGKYTEMFPPDKERTLVNFYKKIAADPESLAVAEELVNDMQSVWETGLYLMQTNESYSYEAPFSGARSLNTDELLTLLLSLKRVAGKPEITIESLLHENFEAETGVAKKSEIDSFKSKMIWDQSGNPDIPGVLVNPNVTLPILFIFSVLENLQNPTKKSFFVNGYVPRYFKAQAEWSEKLWSTLKTIIDLFAEGFYVTEVPRLLVLHGGGSRKKRYPKRTRKAKQKQAKRKQSKRKTRRSKKV